MNLGSLSLSVTISDGEFSNTIPAVVLAAAFQIPPRTCCNVLQNLLFETSYPHPDAPVDNFSGEGTIGEGERSETLEEIYISKRSRTLGGGLGEDIRAERLAENLACALGDRRSLAGFYKLARTYPHDLLQEAERRTMLIPDAQVRRTRGALFTAIVRKLADCGWVQETQTRR